MRAIAMAVALVAAGLVLLLAVLFAGLAQAAVWAGLILLTMGVLVSVVSFALTRRRRPQRAAWTRRGGAL